jgi:hypothetical protein
LPWFWRIGAVVAEKSVPGLVSSGNAVCAWSAGRGLCTGYDGGRHVSAPRGRRGRRRGWLVWLPRRPSIGKVPASKGLNQRRRVEHGSEFVRFAFMRQFNGVARFQSRRPEPLRGDLGLDLSGQGRPFQCKEGTEAPYLRHGLFGRVLPGNVTADAIGPLAGNGPEGLRDRIPSE